MLITDSVLVPEQWRLELRQERMNWLSNIRSSVNSSVVRFVNFRVCSGCWWTCTLNLKLHVCCCKKLLPPERQMRVILDKSHRTFRVFRICWKQRRPKYLLQKLRSRLQMTHCRFSAPQDIPVICLWNVWRVTHACLR